MKEWELRLGLPDAEGLIGQWEEGGFPGTTQMKAQKQKGKDFLDSRKKETAPSASIAGGEPGDNDGANLSQQIEDSAKEIAAFAKASRPTADGMF